MGGTPFADAGDVFGAAEIGLVLGLGDPPTLTGALAGLATGRLGTELLMPEVPSLGKKRLIATEAFTSESGPSHDPGRRPQTPRARNGCRRRRSTEGRRRTKKEEKVGSAKGRKKTSPEENPDFKPLESPGFRIGVHTCRVLREAAFQPGKHPRMIRGTSHNRRNPADRLRFDKYRATLRRKRR